MGNTSSFVTVMKIKGLCFGVLVVFVCAACSSSSRAQQTDSDLSSQPVTTEKKDLENKAFYSFFVKGDELLHNDYKVVKLSKEVRIEDFDKKVKVTYARLENKDDILATFDGLYYPLGNFTNFGLASLFDNDSKQLLVSQTDPRGGRHWVVDLASDAVVLFDSAEFNLGREEAFVMDVDGNGIKEIGLLLTEFWGFGPLAMADHRVLPMIVFKYDSKLRKYLPANQVFAYGIDHIEDEANAVDQDEKPSDPLASEYLGRRLGVLLHYVYAGKKDEGWAFFDRSYRLADAQEMKKKIRARLKNDPVYKFIYNTQGN